MAPAPSPSDSIPEPSRRQRARHYTRGGLLYWLAFLRLVALIALCAFLYFFWQLQQTRNAEAGYAALALLGLFAFLRAYCFLKARNLRCNLCHGTVMLTNSSHRHRDAHRLPLIGYKWTVILDVLFRRGFRCLHCGSAYRLKK